MDHFGSRLRAISRLALPAPARARVTSGRHTRASPAWAAMSGRRVAAQLAGNGDSDGVGASAGHVGEATDVGVSAVPGGRLGGNCALADRGEYQRGGGLTE